METELPLAREEAVKIVLPTSISWRSITVLLLTREGSDMLKW